MDTGSTANDQVGTLGMTCSAIQAECWRLQRALALLRLAPTCCSSLDLAECVLNTYAFSMITGG